MEKITEKLYPIQFEGKEYNEEDCEHIFKSFYIDKICYVEDIGVYVSEGMWVTPTDEFIEY